MSPSVEGIAGHDSLFEPWIVPNGLHALIGSQSVKDTNPFLSGVPHGVEGEGAVAERFHSSELHLERGRESIRTWASVGRDKIEV